MKLFHTPLDDLYLIEYKVFYDERGFLMENFNEKEFQKVTGTSFHFVQDNYTHSLQSVLRGLHYQIYRPQGKLITVIQGEIFDVAVDIRPESRTFGQWCGVYLSAEKRQQFWIPPGFAHGFMVLSERTRIYYKLTDYYIPEYQRCILWSDISLAIKWPSQEPILSEKDSMGEYWSSLFHSL